MKKQIPVFVEFNGVSYNRIEMLRDFEFYSKATGRSKVQWQKWRTQQMKKYCIDENTLNEF